MAAPSSSHPDCATIADIRRQASHLESSGNNLVILLGNVPTSKSETPVNDPITDFADFDMAPNLPYAQPRNVNADLTARCQQLSVNDPRTLLPVRASTNRAVHITNFLSGKSKKRRQNRRRKVVLAQGPDDRIALKTDEDHPYSGI